MLLWYWPAYLLKRRVWAAGALFVKKKKKKAGKSDFLHSRTPWPAAIKRLPLSLSVVLEVSNSIMMGGTNQTKDVKPSPPTWKNSATVSQQLLLLEEWSSCCIGLCILISCILNSVDIDKIGYIEKLCVLCPQKEAGGRMNLTFPMVWHTRSILLSVTAFSQGPHCWTQPRKQEIHILFLMLSWLWNLRPRKRNFHILFTIIKAESLEYFAMFFSKISPHLGWVTFTEVSYRLIHMLLPLPLLSQSPAKLSHVIW